MVRGVCAIMRVSVVPWKVMLLIGKDSLEARFDLVNNIGIFLGAGDFQGKVLQESWAGDLMIPLLRDSFWEFSDQFTPSEKGGPLVLLVNVTNEVCSVRRIPGSRMLRDLMIAAGSGSFQRWRRTFRKYRLSMTLESSMKKTKWTRLMKKTPCTRSRAMFARWVIVVESSMHQKPRDDCVGEDPESIDLAWFESTTSNPLKNVFDACCDGSS